MFQRISAGALVPLVATLSMSAACSRAEKNDAASSGSHAHYAPAGPDKPNAGMRHMIALGLISCTSSQPRPKCSITRGA